jgi:hypothetical protein
MAADIIRMGAGRSAPREADMTRGSFGRIGGSGRSRLSAAGIAAGALIIAGAAFPLLVGAAAPNPSSGTATIDGNPGEWDLAGDFFADMTSGGAAGRPVLATLYVRYDCATEVLAGLVLVKDGEHGQQTRPENAYLRIDGTGKAVSGLSGNDGTPPDFAWVNPDGTFADGFEASISLAPGTYTLRAHILIDDDTADGYTSFDTVPRDAPLVISCEAPSQAAESQAAESQAAESQPVASETVASEAPVASASEDASELPAVGSGSPSDDGQVEGIQGTPRITPPPTDTPGISTATAPAAGWIAVGLALIAFGVFLAIPSGAVRRRR